MSEFGFFKNGHRFDPYKNFKFKVKWDGTYVAGVSKVGALKRTTEVVSHRHGGDTSSPRHSPATTKYEPITLERGITHDPEFEKWAMLVHNTKDGDAAMSLADFRKEITIELWNEQNVIVRSYSVTRCWVSEYQALPELDANGNAVAFETITIQNEGWQRDDAVVEQKET